MEFFKKYKIYVAILLTALSVTLLCTVLFKKPEEQLPSKSATSDENLVYFEVNPQNKLSEVPKNQVTEPAIDESELKTEEYNKELAETLIPAKPSVKLPTDKEISPKTYALPRKPYKLHKKHSKHAKKYIKKSSISSKASIKKLLTPINILTAPINKCLNQLPFIETPQKAIKAIRIDYVNAFELADFINKNLPQPEDKKLAIAKGSGEIILVGTEENISKAEKIIELLDTHPKIAVFKLDYTTPYKMAVMLSNSVFGGNCNIRTEGDDSAKTNPFVIYYNNSQNSITITGASSKQIELAQEFIKFTDVKLPQAFLDIMLVEFNEKGSCQFHKISPFNTSQTNAEYGVSNQQLYSLISGIICNKGGKILAKPRLTVSNNSDYCVNITSDYVQSRQSKYVYNIEDCGVKLKIHSVINPKGEVFLTLAPQYVTVKRAIPNERNAKATLFNRKSFYLENVKLQNCQTLCFGGINSQQEYASFGRKKTKNSELILFVNVHVLD